LATVPELSPDFLRLHARAVGVRELVDTFAQETEPGDVRWIDLSPQQARLV